MVVTGRPTPVHTLSVEDAIENLRRDILQYERVYEMPSEAMFEAVQSGERNDTAEIAVWMIRYQELQYLTA